MVVISQIFFPEIVEFWQISIRNHWVLETFIYEIIQWLEFSKISVYKIPSRIRIKTGEGLLVIAVSKWQKYIRQNSGVGR